MDGKVPMTRPGYDALLAELKHLKSVVRPQVIEAVRTARAEGDLRENAEYHGAREKQAIIDGKIRHLEAQLANAEIIDPSTLGGNRVAFGATVHVRDTGNDAERLFRLVGPDEADPQRGWISVQSPVGSALVGKEVGDAVSVRAPKGTIEYEIVAVSFGDPPSR